MLISFGLGSRRKHSFQWNMGFSLPMEQAFKPRKEVLNNNVIVKDKDNSLAQVQSGFINMTQSETNNSSSNNAQ